MYSEVKNTFGTWDYVIFGVVLAISAGIGIYFAWIDRKKGTKEYMMGGGNVGPLPIGMTASLYIVYRVYSMDYRHLMKQNCSLLIIGHILFSSDSTRYSWRILFIWNDVYILSYYLFILFYSDRKTDSSIQRLTSCNKRGLSLVD